jgi:acyl-CoA synthetase (AMP-forming)/AMP-acid ligase II
VRRDERAALDLSTWRTAFNGSEPVRYATMEAFQRAFGECGFRWEAFRPAYGLAESTLLVTSSGADEAPHVFHADPDALRAGAAEPAIAGRQSVTLVSCGRSAQGTSVAIVDPKCLRRCAAGRVGEIWVHGASVAAGYWQSEASTGAAFDARIADGREGGEDSRPFLRTGDLGFMRGGHLFVTGRLKDLLIVRGVKHYPQDVEITVEHAHASIRPHGAGAFNHQQDGHPSVAIVVEVARRTDDEPWRQSDLSAIAGAVAQAVCAAHGFAPGTIALVEAGAIPRTTSGKIERYRCAQLLDEDTALLYRWNSAPPALDEEPRRAAS